MRREWTTYEVSDLIRWRREGTKCVIISRRLNRTVFSVKKKLTSLRVLIQAPVNKRKPGELLPLVGRQLKLGKPIIDIALMYNVSPNCISQLRKKLGYPPVTPQDRLHRAWLFRRSRGDKAFKKSN